MGGLTVLVARKNSAPCSVIGAAANIRDVGAYCVSGEKTDNQAEANPAYGNRNFLIGHSDRATHSRLLTSRPFRGSTRLVKRPREMAYRLASRVVANNG